MLSLLKWLGWVILIGWGIARGLDAGPPWTTVALGVRAAMLAIEAIVRHKRVADERSSYDATKEKIAVRCKCSLIGWLK
jgi:hypothetical protein